MSAPLHSYLTTVKRFYHVASPFWFQSIPSSHQQAKQYIKKTQETERKGEIHTKYPLEAYWHRFFHFLIAPSLSTHLSHTTIARSLSVLLFVLIYATTELHVHISHIQRDISNALADKNRDAFYEAIQQFVIVIIIASPLFAMTTYVKSTLTRHWRNFMTEYYIHLYFTNRRYVDLNIHSHTTDTHIDHPDQRICDDIHAFTRVSLTLITDFVDEVMTLIAFTGVLWSIAPSLVFGLIIYTTIGTYIATYFAQRLISLSRKQSDREATLRYHLIRVREYNESIALYGGEGVERKNVEECYERVQEGMKEAANVERK